MTYTTLHPDDRRLLQEVTALLRGVLAALPRPAPPGDWGRSHAAPDPVRRRPMPVAVAPAPLFEPESGVRMVRMERPARNRKHTDQSKEHDRKRIDAWLSEFRLSLHMFAKACGVNSGQLHLVYTKKDGMSALMEKRILFGVEQLRAQRAAR